MSPKRIVFPTSFIVKEFVAKTVNGNELKCHGFRFDFPPLAVALLVILKLLERRIQHKKV